MFCQSYRQSIKYTFCRWRWPRKKYPALTRSWYLGQGNHPDTDLTAGLEFEISPMLKLVPESGYQIPPKPEHKMPSIPEASENKIIPIPDLVQVSGWNNNPLIPSHPGKLCSPNKKSSISSVPCSVCCCFLT